MQVALVLFAMVPHSLQIYAIFLSFLTFRNVAFKPRDGLLIPGLCICFLVSPKLALMAAFNYFSVRYDRIILSKFASVVLIFGLTSLLAADQLLGIGWSANFASFFESESGHAMFFQSRIGGPQLSPNYFALTLYILIIAYYRNREEIVARPGFFCVALVFIFLSGSKTAIMLAMSLLYLGPILSWGSVLFALALIFFSFFVPRLQQNPDLLTWFTIKNRLDGYAFAFGEERNLQGWFFGMDVEDYYSAFDSSWSLMFWDVGLLGSFIMMVIIVRLVKQIFSRFGFIATCALLGGSALHPVFFHSVMTPALILAIGRRVR